MRRAGRVEVIWVGVGLLAPTGYLYSYIQHTGISQSLSRAVLGCDEVGERLSTEPRGGSEEGETHLASVSSSV